MTFLKYSKWEPGLTNVYEGTVEWEKSKDQIDFDVTLYKSINENDYEEKEWTLTIESVIYLEILIKKF